MSLSILMCFFTVFEDAPLYNMFVNMFPLSGVPVGPESFCTGGCKVNWGNKSCKYVYKYFFVFLSIQFLSIVFSMHCKVTANHKLICFKLLCISFHMLISRM